MYVQNPQLRQQIQDKLSDRIQDLYQMDHELYLEENKKITPDEKDEKLVKGRSESCWYGINGESLSIKQSYQRFIRSNKEEQEFNKKVSQQTFDELIDAMDNLEDSEILSDEKPQKFGCASVGKLSSLGKESKVAFKTAEEKLQSMLEEQQKFDVTSILNKMGKDSMLELAKNLTYELKKTKANNKHEKELKDSLKDALLSLKEAEGDLEKKYPEVKAGIFKQIRFMLRAKKNRIVYNNFTKRLRDHLKKSMENFVIKNDELALMIGKENFYELERLSEDISVEKMKLESNIVHFNEQLQFISTDGSQNFFTSDFKLPKGSFKTMLVFKKLFVDHWFECKFNDAFSKPEEGLDFVNEFTKDYLRNCLKALRCLKRDLKEQNKTIGQSKHVSIEYQENTITQDYMRKICFADSDCSDVDDCESESESQDFDLLNYGEMSRGLIANELRSKVKELQELGHKMPYEDFEDEDETEGQEKIVDEKEEAEDKEEEAEDKKEEAEDKKEEAEDKKEEAEVQKESKGSKKTVKMLSDDESD